MNQNLKHFLRLLVQSIIFCTIAMFCYGIFRYYGIDHEIAFTLKKGFQGRRGFVEPLMVLSATGFGLSILYALVDFVFEKYALKNMECTLNLRQVECNRHNVALLISEKLLKELKLDKFSTSKLLGTVLLKGKRKEVKIHTVHMT